MRGKRAPELACGLLLGLVNQMFENGLLSLLSQCEGLSEQEHQQIIAEYSSARSALVATLSLKLQYWFTLPWKLAGVYHWDRQLASKCARECLDLFDASPNTEGHHRISLEFLSSSGRWRAEVEQVANGTSVLVLSIAFLKRSMQLGLAPVVERAMEARHAYVSNRIRIGKKKKRGATTVSLASGRMTELKERARVNPHFAEVMGRHLQVMRNPRRALEALGLIHHP